MTGRATGYARAVKALAPGATVSRSAPNPPAKDLKSLVREAPPSPCDISMVIRISDHAAANVVVAEMAQIFCEVDHIFRDMERDEFLALAETMARLLPAPIELTSRWSGISLN